jgi:PAS domain S-box-containing protein
MTGEARTQPIRRWRLRVTLTLLFVAQVVVAIALVGSLSLWNGQRAVQDLAQQLGGEVMERVQHYVQSYLETSRLMLRLDAAAVRTGHVNPDDFEQLQRFFWEQVQLTPEVRTLYYGNEAGDFLQVEMNEVPTLSVRTAETAPNWVIYALDEQGQRGEVLETRPYDPRQRPWYQAAQQSQELIWSAIYAFVKPPVLGITPAIALYQTPDPPPVSSNLGAQRPRPAERPPLRGVLAIDLPLSQLSSFLQSLPLATTGEVFILDRNGAIVASSTPEPPQPNAQGQPAPVQANQSSNPVLRETAAVLESRLGSLGGLAQDQPLILPLRVAGDRYQVAVLPLRGSVTLPWSVAVAIPDQTIFARVDANSRFTLALCVVATGAAIALGSWVARRIAQPILSLDRAAAAIARGHLDLPQPLAIQSRIIEVHRLVHSFEQMSVQLRYTFMAWEETHANLESLIDQRTQALRESEERFSKAFRASPDPSAISTLDTGELIDVNNSFLRAFGYRTAEVIGRRSTDLNLWENLRDRAAFVAELRRHGRVRDRTVTFQTALGQSRIMRVSAEQIRLGDRDCVLWVSHDLTELERLEAFRRQQEQSLRLILDTIPQQVFWKDTNLVFLGCNQHWAEAAGIEDASNVVGKTDYDLIPNSALADTFRAEDRRVMDTNEPIWHRIAPKYRAGPNGQTRWLDISKVPIHDASGQVVGILGVIEDITQRKLAEEASEKLLLNVLPASVVDQLKQDAVSIAASETRDPYAQNYDEVGILFADIVGFTPLATRLPPLELVTLLNEVFSHFDRLSERYHLEKIKTIGDAYMVAAGLPVPHADPVGSLANMALDMQQAIADISQDLQAPLHIRVGIHAGPVVAGVIGIKKFIYDLWGDTVNIASRMESHGEPGRIQVSATIRDALGDRFQFAARGYVDVKGLGPMPTYWLVDRISPAERFPT